MESIFFGLTGLQWIQLGISLVIVAVALLLGRWLVRFLLDRVIRRLTRFAKSRLDGAILNSIRLPLYWLVVIASMDAAIQRLTFVPEAWEQGISSFFYVLYLLVGFATAWRFILNIFSWYGKEIASRTKSNLDEQLLPFFRRIALILLGVIGIITLLGYFNIEIGALVTTLGIGSLAIALAAQATLSDTISGFVIMVDRPFRIGDRIEIQDLDTWGDVMDIGLRSSKIRTRDNRMVIIPNSVLSKSLIVNHSFPDTQYRIQIKIGIAYGSELKHVRQVMEKAVQGVSGVLPDRPVEALLLEFGESALIFRVRWWIESYVDTRQMFDRVNTALYEALNQAGIELPNPQLTVHHEFKPGEGRLSIVKE